jgi:hypothetical protein
MPVENEDALSSFSDEKSRSEREREGELRASLSLSLSLLLLALLQTSRISLGLSRALFITSALL